MNNGILLSCAYDKCVIAWEYQKELEIQRFEKNEELRCLDYIEQQGKLFVGTNSNIILTIDIGPLLEINAWYDNNSSLMKKGMEMGMDMEGFDLHEIDEMEGSQHIRDFEDDDR